MLRQIDLLELLSSRRNWERRQKHWLSKWLLGLGWRHAQKHSPTELESLFPEFGVFSERWREPHRDTDWSFHGAVRIVATVEAARMLRARGWFAPHEYGLIATGPVCRAPGTWEAIGEHRTRSLSSSKAPWLRLSAALKQAGLRYWDPPRPTVVKARAPEVAQATVLDPALLANALREALSRRFSR